MTDSPLVQRQRALLRDLVRLAAERAKAEQEAEADLLARTRGAERQLQQARQDARAVYEGEQEALKQDYEKERQDVLARFDQERKTAEREFSAARRRLATDGEAA